MSGVVLGAAAVTAGAGIYAQHQASKAAKGTKTQQGVEKQLYDNLKQTSPIGLNMLKGGQGNVDIYNAFYKKLATGDRSSAMQLLAPQFAMMDRQRSGGQGAQLALNPKGGGSAEGNLNSMDNSLADRNNAILGLRTSSVDKLGALGMDQISGGNALLGQGSSSGLGLMGAIQNTQNSAFDQSRSAGAGMFQILQMLQGGGGGAGAGMAGRYNDWRAGRAVNRSLDTNGFGKMMQFSPGVQTAKAPVQTPTIPWGAFH